MLSQPLERCPQVRDLLAGAGEFVADTRAFAPARVSLGERRVSLSAEGLARIEKSRDFVRRYPPVRATSPSISGSRTATS
ncbi:MAG TPA: hypothetical protein PKW35_18205, partial [Nannocystaceae bacterium]|nr:hypothetical protein [Nannocystaceae bacterium]